MLAYRHTKTQTCSLQHSAVICNNQNLLHPFNSLFSKTTCMHKLVPDGKTSLDLNDMRDDGGFGMQLDHMQSISTSLQTDNHINTSSLNFYRLDALSDARPTVSKH